MVTGVNGHLGHNLVLELRAQGQRVIAGVRHHHHHAALSALGCRVAQVEMLDRYSLEMAMDGVDTVYQVAAVFKHWARDPEREIYRANIEGTRNVLEAAAPRRESFLTARGAHPQAVGLGGISSRSRENTPD